MASLVGWCVQMLLLLTFWFSLIIIPQDADIERLVVVAVWIVTVQIA